MTTFNSAFSGSFEIPAQREERPSLESLRIKAVASVGLFAVLIAKRILRGKPAESWEVISAREEQKRRKELCRIWRLHRA